MGPPTTRPIAERVARIHHSILEAVESRDSRLARERMLDHLAAVSGAGKSQTSAQLVASV
jgi:DNA-binding FadR family transcriptional regulator